LRPVEARELWFADLGERQIEGDPPLPEADHAFGQQRQQRRIMERR
jgi:hypothetical protein